MKKIIILVFLTAFVTVISVAQKVVSRGQEIDLSVKNDSLIAKAWLVYQKLSAPDFKKESCNYDAAANGYYYSAVSVGGVNAPIKHYLHVDLNDRHASFDFQKNVIATTYFPGEEISAAELVKISSAALENFFREEKSLASEGKIDQEIRSWIDEIKDLTNKLDSKECGRGRYGFNDGKDYFSICYYGDDQPFTITEILFNRCDTAKPEVKSNKLSLSAKEGRMLIRQNMSLGSCFISLGHTMVPRYEGQWAARVRLREIWSKFQVYEQELLQKKSQDAKKLVTKKNVKSSKKIKK